MLTTGEIVGTEKKLEENKMFKKLKDKKGFTLVELIVVLVILAILAALLVPALTGYIDKAKEKSIEAKTRNIVVATQTLIDEKYGTVKLEDTTKLNAEVAIGATTEIASNKITISADDITKLAEVDVTTGENANVTGVKINVNKDDGAIAKIVELTYKENGKECTYKVEDGNTTFSFK